MILNMDYKMYEQCTVITGTRPYLVNRFVFSRHSQYFAEELKKYEENPLLEITIPDIPYSVFDLIILWMEGKNIEPGLKKIAPLWEASVRLIMSGLQQYVESLISRLFKTMCPATVYDNLIITGNDLFQSTLRCIYASLFYEVTESKYFSKFSLKQVCKLLSIDELRIHSEKEIMKVAFQWLNYKWEKRRCYLPKILESIRFDRLSDMELDRLYDDPQLEQFIALPECEQMLMDTIISRSKCRQKMEPAAHHPPQKSHSDQNLRTFQRNQLKRPSCGQHHSQPKFKAANSDNLSTNQRLYSIRNCPSSYNICNHNYCFPKQQVPVPNHETSLKNSKSQFQQRSCGDSRLVAGGSRKTNFRISAEHFTKQSKDMQRAAIKIQSFYRGYRTRNRWKELLQDLKQGIIVLGGTNPASVNSSQNIERQVLYYDGRQSSWITLYYKPESRLHAAYAYLNEKIYVSGGSREIKDQSNGGLVATNQVESLDLKAGKWEEVGKMLFPRIHHSLMINKGRLYAIGGMDDRGNLLRAVEYFSPSVNRWKSASPIKSPRMAMAAVVCGGGLWILGGIGILKDGHTYVIKKTVEFYDTEKDVWQKRPSLRQPRCFASAVTKGHRLFVIGGAMEGKSRYGCSYTTLGEIDAFDFSTWEWTTFTRLPISRFNCSSVIVDDDLFVVGGVTEMQGKPLQSVDKFNFNTNGWSLDIPTLPTPMTGMGAFRVVLPNPTNNYY